MLPEEIHPEVDREARCDSEGLQAMSGYEVEQPILNSPFEEPQEYWRIVEGEAPRRMPGRRPAMYFYRHPSGEATRRSQSEARDRDRAEAGQPHPRAREGLASNSGLCGRDPHHAGAAEVLAARGPGAAAVLRPDRGGGDDHLPHRGAAGFPPGHRDPAATSRARTARPKGFAAFRRYACKMATGSGQDHGHGDAGGLEHPEQGQRPRRQPVLRRGAGRLPERDHPQPPAGAGPEAGRSEPLPHARPGAAAPDAAI